VPADAVCDRSIIHACTSLGRAPETFLRRAWEMQWAPGSRPDLALPWLSSADGFAGPIPGGLGNHDLVLVVDATSVKLAGLSSVILSSATLQHVKILEHSQPFRVDPARLKAALAELADVAHLNVASPMRPSLATPPGAPCRTSNPLLIFVLEGLLDHLRWVDGDSEPYRYRCATQRTVRSVRTTHAHLVGECPPMADDYQGWVSPGSLGSPGLARSRLNPRCACRLVAQAKRLRHLCDTGHDGPPDSQLARRRCTASGTTCELECPTFPRHPSAT
jgi:hypothetical protein